MSEYPKVIGCSLSGVIAVVNSAEEERRFRRVPWIAGAMVVVVSMVLILLM